MNTVQCVEISVLCQRVCALHTATKVSAALGRTARPVVAHSLHVAARPHLATLYALHESARALSAFRQRCVSTHLTTALTAAPRRQRDYARSDTTWL